jgi:hypothetical protein
MTRLWHPSPGRIHLRNELRIVSLKHSLAHTWKGSDWFPRIDIERSLRLFGTEGGTTPRTRLEPIVGRREVTFAVVRVILAYIGCTRSICRFVVVFASVYKLTAVETRLLQHEQVLEHSLSIKLVRMRRSDEIHRDIGVDEHIHTRRYRILVGRACTTSGRALSPSAPAVFAASFLPPSTSVY